MGYPVIEHKHITYELGFISILSFEIEVRLHGCIYSFCRQYHAYACVPYLMIADSYHCLVF